MAQATPQAKTAGIAQQVTYPHDAHGAPSIRYFAEGIDFALPHPARTTSWIQQVIWQEGYQLVHLNFIFCTDAYLHAKNLQYLQHDTLTDVLTFDYAQDHQTVEGDIYISLAQVQENAASYQHTLWQELYTVMIHGVLHLVGYDDATAASQAQMREKEALYRSMI
ncbi:MAG: rRNA maturation RNase YbeY [Bacteroidota bacterium]